MYSSPSSDRKHGFLCLSSSFVAAIVSLAGGASAAAVDPAPRYPPNTVLLLVAPWCAPCHAEIARLDAIAGAANPHPVRVVLMEDGGRAQAMVRNIAASRRWEPAAGEVRNVRMDLAGRTAGLPYSVLTDHNGRICADQAGGLDPARVRALIARCQRQG